MKMVTIRLLATAMIRGVPRSPAEGLQVVSESEAKRLIENKQAIDAEADIDTAEANDEIDDDLKGKSLKQIRKIAKDEGVDVEGDANKDATKAAVRKHRADKQAAEQQGDGLEAMDEAALRKIAETEEVELADDIDQAAIVTAIRTKRDAAKT